MNHTLVNSDFIWNGGPCIEIYKEPYPKKNSEDLAQIFIPVTLSDNIDSKVVMFCTYCGSYYFDDKKDVQLKKCCKSTLRLVRFDQFGSITFLGDN